MRIAARSVIIASAIVIAGCGGTAIESSSINTEPPISSVDFTASLLDGSPITLSEQLAQRPVALWFWAPG